MKTLHIIYGVENVKSATLDKSDLVHLFNHTNVLSVYDWR
jgi:hypothetical protein